MVEAEARKKGIKAEPPKVKPVSKLVASKPVIKSKLAELLETEEI